MNKEENLSNNIFFETIKCEDYDVFNLDYHNKRVANAIAMNLNLQEYIYPLNNKLLRCKVIYDDSGILEVNYFAYKKREINSFKLVYCDDIDYSKKYLNRNSIDKLFLQKDSCDEIIIVKNSIITDTSIANIAIFYDGFWITSKTPLLKGTTRARLLEEKFLIEKDISVDMLKNAEKIALMNAMIDFDIKKDFIVK